MTDSLSRRDAVKLLGGVPLVVSRAEIERAWRAVGLARRGSQDPQPKFFSAHEWQTVRLLADIILPRDERSGSATDAAVPEFMDFILADSTSENRKTQMRGGLAWLDTECRERHGNDFVDCTDAQRTALLNQLAWPAKAPEELSHGVRFFNMFRDMTASGFWSSKMGVADLQYMGNTFVQEWTGCPDAQLEKIGVKGEQ